MALNIDLVIPTYGRPQLLPALVRRLAGQCCGADRLILVWQGTEPLPDDFGAPVLILRQPVPNLPAARNRGIDASGADVILFLDDDTVPFDGLVEAHRACYRDENIGGVAGWVDDPLFDPTLPRPSTIDLTKGDCRQNFAFAESRETVSAMGANMSFRRSALVAVGGFDEHFTHNALWEEVDCCLRLLAKGYRLWFCAEAKVKHGREGAGGCRNEKGVRYRFHQFANTAYFAARFARREDYPKWLTFWKYRLEYLSRKNSQLSGRLFRHDPSEVAAGFAGAIAGIARYALSRMSINKRIGGIDKKAVSAALAASGSGAAV